MRRALVPISLRPMRDTERTSTRVPAPQGVSRTTTSSLNPNQRVVSVASMRPLLLSAVTICHPCFLRRRQGAIESLIKRYRQRNRGQVRISLALEFGDFGSPLEAIRCVRAERHDASNCGGFSRSVLMSWIGGTVRARPLEFERHAHRNQPARSAGAATSIWTRE